MKGQTTLLYRDWPLLVDESPMTTHHSADARTALMASYIARHANPRVTRAAPQSKGRDADKGSGGSFGARGRTIYNAHAGKERCGALGEVERIDREEERRRRHGEQFLMAARGDFEESSSRETTPMAAETATAEEMTAEDMFVLYMQNI
jgi:hypothetical protein